MATSADTDQGLGLMRFFDISLRKVYLSKLLRLGINSTLEMVNSDGSRTSLSLDEIKNVLDTSSSVADLTAASTLTAADSGKTFFLNSATEFATTLPSPAAGLRFKFVVKAAPASASYTVVTASSANIIIGGINELEVDTTEDGPYIADGDTITFVDGVAVVGDYVDLVSDGTSWYVSGQANADGGITLTQAS
jgi:hypothetical protein